MIGSDTASGSGGARQPFFSGLTKALKEGVLAFQVHAGFTMDVQFKDVKIKLLDKAK